MKLSTTTAVLLAIATAASAQAPIFDSLAYSQQSITMPDGHIVNYKAYNNVPYVGNVMDTSTQRMNIFVPDNVADNSAILLWIATTDFRATLPNTPSTENATAYALNQGMVVCIPGIRGTNSMCINNIYKKSSKKKKKKQKGLPMVVDAEVWYCGKLPAPLIDLKASVRFLRANDANIPGSSERIVADGYLAGAGLAALLGVSANDAVYDSLLNEVGAASVSDEVWAVACYEPITSKLNASLGAQWLYNRNANFATCIDSMAMLIPDTETALTFANYQSYINNLLYASAKDAINNGEDVNEMQGADIFADSNESDLSEYFYSLDFDRFTLYLKEMKYLGNYSYAKIYDYGTPTNLALAEYQMDLDRRLYQTNTSSTKNWFVRHGAFDSRVPITESINLATRLSNLGVGVDFQIPWYHYNRGDFDTAGLMEWIHRLQEAESK